MKPEVTEERRLPPIDKVLTSPAGRSLADRFGHQRAVAGIRRAVGRARDNTSLDRSVRGLADAASHMLEEEEVSRLKTVFNLTGTVLHTNLGRAQLAEAAILAAEDAMRNAVALEFDIEQGHRGERDDHLRDLLCELTGAEDATLVNNNAAAVLITLNTLSEGRGAIVSRGELIEIGGAFRMPEIMARAGAALVEVGTTNRTHRRDYVDAIDEDTGLLLKVHTSNYRIEGFTAAVPTQALAEIARSGDIPLVEDLGSGTLIDPVDFGLPHEPTVRQTVDAGADIVTFSGDKMLGGPQAGFIVGRKELIARINKNPMKRALRIDKIRLAAVEATLRLYRNPDRLAATIPTYRYLSRKADEIRLSAERLAPKTAALLGASFKVSVADCTSQVGSGAMPAETLQSAGLAISPVSASGRALDRLTHGLRRLPVPVIGRTVRQALVLDLRCLESEDRFLANLEPFQMLETPS